MRKQNRRIDPALRTNYIARRDGVTMAIREIIKLPDKRLRLRSEPVKQVDAAIRKLVDDMFETMYKAPGIGLAAIQVGVAKRVITLDLSKKEDDHEPQVLINPEVLWQSEERAKFEEGCLSIPDYYGSRAAGRGKGQISRR